MTVVWSLDIWLFDLGLRNNEKVNTHILIIKSIMERQNNIFCAFMAVGKTE